MVVYYSFADHTMTLVEHWAVGGYFDSPGNITVSPWGGVVIAEDSSDPNHLVAFTERTGSVAVAAEAVDQHHVGGLGIRRGRRGAGPHRHRAAGPADRVGHGHVPPHRTAHGPARQHGRIRRRPRDPQPVPRPHDAPGQGRIGAVRDVVGRAHRTSLARRGRGTPGTTRFLIT